MANMLYIFWVFLCMLLIKEVQARETACCDVISDVRCGIGTSSFKGEVEALDMLFM